MGITFELNLILNVHNPRQHIQVYNKTKSLENSDFQDDMIESAHSRN